MRRRNHKRKRGRKRKFKRRGGRVSKGFSRKVKTVLYKQLEHKAYDFSANTGTISNAGTFIPIGPVASTPNAGTAVNQRIGDEIRLRSIKVNFVINAGTGSAQDNMTMVVGCWKDYVQSSPTVTKIFQDYTHTWTSLFERAALQTKEWIPIMMKRMTLTPVTVGPSVIPRPGITNQWTIRLSLSGKRLPIKKINYRTAIPQAYYFCLFITDNVLTTLPGGSYNGRYTYVDA
jgi:hypothetical protein